IHSEDRVPALLAGLHDRLVEPHPRVVDQHVEPAELLSGAADERDRFGLTLGTRLDEERAGPLAAQLVDDALSARGVHIGDRAAGAFLDEEPYRRLADPGGATRDRGDFSSEPCHLPSPVLGRIRVAWTLARRADERQRGSGACSPRYARPGRDRLASLHSTARCASIPTS